MLDPIKHLEKAIEELRRYEKDKAHIFDSLSILTNARKHIRLANSIIVVMQEEEQSNV